MRPRNDSGPVAIRVHDGRTWSGRGLYFDLLGLSVMILSGVSVALDLYAAGYARAFATGSASASFAPLARLGLGIAVLVGSFAWVAARLLRAAYREIPRVDAP